MKTVLITGASGFIGRELTGALLAKGYNVIGTDKAVSPYSGQPNFSFIQCDITDKNKIIGVIEGSKIDALIHLACSVDNDFPSVITDKEMNISKQVDKYLFKAVMTSDITDIILLSTSKIYALPKTRELIRETTAEKPVTNYAKMKYDTEKAMYACTRKTDIKEVIMRVAPVYSKNYIQNLHDKIFDPKDQVAFLYRDGNYGFSFCNVYNLVDFIRGVLTQDENYQYQGVYNVCDTRPITAQDIVEFEREFHRLGAVVQKNISAEAVKATLTMGKQAKQDYRFVDPTTIMNNNYLDNTKAQRIATFRWKLANTK